VKPLVVVACLLALPALADEKPDYSRDNLTRLFAQRDIEPPSPPGRVQWHLGWVDFRALNMDWRIVLLPLPMLPGSRLNDTGKLPNPLELTNTPAPNAHPFIIEPSAEVAREVRRVRRRTGL
jgi:hypothetical protein